MLFLCQRGCIRRGACRAARNPVPTPVRFLLLFLVSKAFRNGFVFWGRRFRAGHVSYRARDSKGFAKSWGTVQSENEKGFKTLPLAILRARRHPQRLSR